MSRSGQAVSPHGKLLSAWAPGPGPCLWRKGGRDAGWGSGRCPLALGWGRAHVTDSCTRALWSPAQNSTGRIPETWSDPGSCERGGGTEAAGGAEGWG